MFSPNTKWICDSQFRILGLHSLDVCLESTKQVTGVGRGNLDVDKVKRYPRHPKYCFRVFGKTSSRDQYIICSFLCCPFYPFNDAHVAIIQG